MTDLIGMENSDKARELFRKKCEQILKEKARERNRCEADLSYFLKKSWPSMEQSQYIPGFHTDAVCEHLMAVSSGEINRLLINIPPRTGKTNAVSIAWPAWTWAQQEITDLTGPQTAFLCASYGNSLALDISTKCRRLIESDWYQNYWGDRFDIRADQNTKSRFDTTAGGARIATSVGGALTGLGANILIIDDIHNAQEMESQTVIKSAVQWFSEGLQSRLNNPKTGAIVVIMQRLSDEDLSGYILSKESGYVHLNLPLEYDSTRHCSTSIGWTDPRTEDGELLCPLRIGPDEAEKLKKDLGSYAYCTPHESPVLMADLSMKPIGEISVGESVIGFTTSTEAARGNPTSRRSLVKSRIISISKSVQKVVKITLDSGKIIRCTKDHKWYMGRGGRPEHTQKDGTQSIRPIYREAAIGRKLMRVCDGALGAKFIIAKESVISIDPDGEEVVYGLETETGNYVVWGIASSNSGQYLQSPTPRGGGIIKDKWWKLYPEYQEVMDDYGKPVTPLEYPVMDFVVAFADTAYTTKEENDYSALTIWGVWRKDGAPKVMLMAAWQERLELNDLVNKIKDSCTRPKGVPVDRLLIENKASGKSVAQEIIRLFEGAEFGVELVEPKGDKVSRMYTVQHLFENGIVYAPDRAWAQMVIDQVSKFPRGTHDDLSDTCSGALCYLRNSGFALRTDEYDSAELESRMLTKPVDPLYDI